VNVRVTGQVQTNNAIGFMRQRSGELARAQQQVSSGVRVERPSDDPAAFPALSQFKAAAGRLDTFAQNAGDATATLNASVSALQDVNNLLVRARQIALEGADSAAAADPAARAALAVEVDGLLDQALRSANGRPDGKTVFAGTALDTPPFRVATVDAQGRPATIAYDGATERARTVTAPGQTIDTRYTGDAVFQRPGADVFGSLIALRDALRDTTTDGATRAAAFNQRLGDLDSSLGAINDAMGEQASNLATLESIGTLIGDQKLYADTRVGELEGTDFAEAVVRMKELETALQAIYATTVQIVQPGILDFIR
jgi:flagellar hook-associated protein 3 FlgL